MLKRLFGFACLFVLALFVALVAAFVAIYHIKAAVVGLMGALTVFVSFALLIGLYKGASWGIPRVVQKIEHLVLVSLDNTEDALQASFTWVAALPLRALKMMA